MLPSRFFLRPNLLEEKFRLQNSSLPILVPSFFETHFQAFPLHLRPIETRLHESTRRAPFLPVQICTLSFKASHLESRGYQKQQLGRALRMPLDCFTCLSESCRDTREPPNL